MERFAPATEVISHLLQSGVDLLALGEVDDFVMRSLSESLAEGRFGDFTIRYCEENQGQSDIGIIYNKQKISNLQYQNVIGKYGRSSIRVATKLMCTVGNAADPFFFFVSHWPSRSQGDDGIQKREAAADKLKTLTDGVLEEIGDAYPYIVLLGDFNDEPFDNSLSKKLLASRETRSML